MLGPAGLTDGKTRGERRGQRPACVPLPSLSSCDAETQERVGILVLTPQRPPCHVDQASELQTTESSRSTQGFPKTHRNVARAAGTCFKLPGSSPAPRLMRKQLPPANPESPAPAGKCPDPCSRQSLSTQPIGRRQVTCLQPWGKGG